MLVVYVDDFKMAGPAEHKAALWKDIIGDPEHPERGGIYMGAPEPQKRFLGCDHTLTTHQVHDLETGVKRNIRRMEYNMQPFFEGCLEQWTELTGQPWRDLPAVSTPFVDEDALRKAHGVGPLEFKLPASLKSKKAKPKAIRPRLH